MRTFWGQGELVDGDGVLVNRSKFEQMKCTIILHMMQLTLDFTS